MADATAAEEKAIGIFDALIAAKEKQINADTAAIESKIERIGNLGVEIETMKGDLSDTAQSMIEDKKFLADLDKTCKTKQAEWDERCKVRNDELLALADTIKTLNDDDSLELFKKTLPGEECQADGKEEIVTLTDDIAALTKGLAALDKQVEEAMVNRKEENEDYQSLMANNDAALEIIGMAKNRLNKFYNPAMYVAPASFIQLHKQADALLLRLSVHMPSRAREATASLQ